MIQIGETIYDLNDPTVIGVIIGAGVAVLVLFLLMLSLRRASKSTEAVQFVASQMSRLSQDVQSLGQGQQQLAGNIRTVSDAQATAQVQVVQTMEARLAEVQAQMP